MDVRSRQLDAAPRCTGAFSTETIAVNGWDSIRVRVVTQSCQEGAARRPALPFIDDLDGQLGFFG